MKIKRQGGEILNSQDVILGILMKEALTGYQIKQLLENVFSNFYNSTYGTIYPTLARMEKERLITKEKCAPGRKA